MAGTKINAGKGGHKSVPTPPSRASFVLGSRPQTLRAAPPPRIKPALGMTQYGKTAGGGLGGPGNMSNPAGASFGDTGQNGMS